MNEKSEQIHHAEDEAFYYGDPRIATKHAPIQRWLIWTFIILHIWGPIWWFIFLNGSSGWFGREYLPELQRAANTTFPIENVNYPEGEIEK